MTNCLDPDQARRSVGPDLGPNCLQRLSADDESHRQQRKGLKKFVLRSPFLTEKFDGVDSSGLLINACTVKILSKQRGSTGGSSSL